MTAHSGVEIGAKYGIISGLLMAIITFILYAVDPLLMFQLWLNAVYFGIMVVCMVLAVRDYRQQLGGYLSFKQALQPAFVTTIIMALVSSLVTYLLYNFIDPNLSSLLKEWTMEFTYDMMESMNAPEEVLEKAMNDLEKEDFTFGIAKISQGMIFSIIAGFILASIVAAIMKRKKPLDYLINKDMT